MKIKRFKKLSDIKKYVETFNKINGYDIPISYFTQNKACIRCLVSSEEIKGGYAIVSGQSRSLEQVPQTFLIKQENNGYLIRYPKNKFLKKEKIAEFTGYFMLSNEGRFKLTCFLLFDVFTSKAKYFIYSFAVSNKKLAKYYGYGNPIFIYCGQASKLEGHPSDMESEQVEMLTKVGILKVFLARVFNKYIKGKNASRR